MTPISVISFVSPCAAAGAQPAPGAPMPLALTLDEAVARGIAASHRLASSARGEAAAAVEATRGGDEPQLRGARRLHADQPRRRVRRSRPDGRCRSSTPTCRQPQVAARSAMADLYRRPLDALERAARAEATAAADASRCRARRLEARDHARVLGVVTAAREARRSSEAVERIDAQLADVRSRLDAGLVPPNDVLTVEAQRARQRMLASRREPVARRRGGARATGRRLDGAPIVLDAALETLPAALRAAIEALVAEARTKRPERARPREPHRRGDRTQSAAAGAAATLMSLAAATTTRGPT